MDEYFWVDGWQFTVLHLLPYDLGDFEYFAGGYAIQLRDPDGDLRYLGPIYPTRGAAILDGDTHLELAICGKVD